jgi:hypothetical protein
MTALMCALFAATVATLVIYGRQDRSPLLPVALLSGAMIAAWFIFDMPVAPPRVLTNHPHVITVALVPVLIASWTFGAVYTWRTRSPLFVLSALAGATLWPFITEPLGDQFVTTVYPANTDIVATVFGRGMPWGVLLGYAATVPLVMVAAVEIARRLPAMRVLLLVLGVCVAEVPFEMVTSHYNLIHYYANHALILGVPIYCIAQNGGFIAVTLWGYAHIAPRLQGWRWALVPLVVFAALPCYAMFATFPAYLAIHYHASPVVGWTTGILATAINAAVAVACARSRAVARLRQPAPQARGARSPGHGALVGATP